MKQQVSNHKCRNKYTHWLLRISVSLGSKPCFGIRGLEAQKIAPQKIQQTNWLCVHSYQLEMKDDCIPYGGEGFCHVRNSFFLNAFFFTRPKNNWQKSLNRFIELILIDIKVIIMFIYWTLTDTDARYNRWNDSCCSHYMETEESETNLPDPR